MSGWKLAVPGVVAGVAVVLAIRAGSAWADEPASTPTAAPAATSGVVPVVRVDVQGTGAIPMVLVPGLNCDGTVYDAFMTRNAEKYTMYAVTLAGFAGSQAPGLPEGATYGDMVFMKNAEAAIGRVIEEKKLDRPVLVGHSLGGILAMQAAIDHPEWTRGVVTLDIPVFPMPGEMNATPSLADRARIVQNSYAPQFERMTDDQWQDMWRQNMTVMVKDSARGTEIAQLMAKTPARTGVRYMLEMVVMDPLGRAAELKTPLLAVAALSGLPNAWGGDVEYRSMLTKAYKKSDKATVVFFEGTRHFVMDDAPAELDRAVEQFLAGKPVEGKKLVPVTPPATGAGDKTGEPAKPGEPAKEGEKPAAPK